MSSTTSCTESVAASPTRRARRFFLFSSTVAAGALVLLLPATSASRALPAHQPGSSLFAVLPAVHAAGKETAGYWHTSSNHILDAQNRPVRISGMNWSGFETTNAVVGGLERQDYRTILHTIKSNGFNTVRIPFSNQMVESPEVPDHIAFTTAQGLINEDLRGLNSLEILDHVIRAANHEGLKVILDNHRSEAGSSAEESGLWFTDQYPESAWVADWVKLALRYQADPTVIGMDLRNEPHNAAKGGACWSCGGPNDWHLAATRAGNAVLRANPRLLIFVEGTDQVGQSTTWWGGNLAGVRQAPVHLSVSGRLVYSAHVYGPSEYQQPWFNDRTTPESLAALWEHDWAFISESGIAPVWIGEFGTSNSDIDVRDGEAGSEGQWFGSLVAFLQAHPLIGWTYWGINGEDRYALLGPDYGARPVNQAKAMALATISGAGRLPRFGWDGNVQASRAGMQDASPTSNDAVSIPPTRSADLMGVEERRAQARLQVARSWRPADVSRSRTEEMKTVDAGRYADDNGGLTHEQSVAEQVQRSTRLVLQSIQTDRYTDQ